MKPPRLFFLAVAFLVVSTSIASARGVRMWPYQELLGFALHHYRTIDGTNIPHVVNGPSFVSFTPSEKPTFTHQTYILFLIREADGRYAPVVGQTDPGLGIKEIVGAGK